jgi:hypothetical protein
MIGTPQTEFNNVSGADEAELMQMRAISMTISHFEFALSPDQSGSPWPPGGSELDYARRTHILAGARDQAIARSVRTSREGGM